MTSNSLMYFVATPLLSLCVTGESEGVRERGREGSQFISTSEEWTNSL